MSKLKKMLWIGLLLFAIWVPVGNAQGPIAGGYTPDFKANLGISYTSAAIPSQGNLGMTGIDGGWTADLKPLIGLEVDAGYARNFNAYGSQHTASLITYMGGPVVHPIRGRRLNVFVHALVGGAYESGVNYDPNGDLLHGYVNKAAWALGGGAEYLFDRAIAVRIGADYLRTSFFTPEITITGQYNMRATVGVAYRFGGRHE